ncbi:hypothetical protein C2S51_008836 [Perilla frutescens var. frutescens]|nr:hypothetical protein C2S51_008836 [Perilla frutescens var. frutescens]
MTGQRSRRRLRFQARTECMFEPDGPGTGIVKHKGGSRCAHVHAAALAPEKGLTAGGMGWGTFMRLHGSSDADYSDQKSKRIAGEVREVIEQRSQVPPKSSELSLDTTSIYIDVMGVENRRVFGLGNRASAHIRRSQRSSSADSVGSQYYDSQVAIQELQTQEERFQQREQTWEQKHQEMMDQQLALLQQMQEMQRRFGDAGASGSSSQPPPDM